MNDDIPLGINVEITGGPVLDTVNLLDSLQNFVVHDAGRYKKDEGGRMKDESEWMKRILDGSFFSLRPSYFILSFRYKPKGAVSLRGLLADFRRSSASCDFVFGSTHCRDAA